MNEIKYNKNIKKYKKFTILIPCHNEEETIGTVLANMISLNPLKIVVVDDGSIDKSAKIVKRIQRFSPVPIILLQNLANGGVGFALTRGFQYCKQDGADFIVTVDADNQHSKEDTQKLMDFVLRNKGIDIVSGVRKFSKSIPLSKKLSNFCASTTLFILYGITHPDPLCGLRIYSRGVAENLKLEEGYDWAISVNRYIKSNTDRCQKAYISAIYTKYSLAKGQTIRSGVRMLFKIVRNRFMEFIDILLNNKKENKDMNITIVQEKFIPAYKLNVSSSTQRKSLY